MRSGGIEPHSYKDSNSRVRLLWTLDYFERGSIPISIGFFLEKEGIHVGQNNDVR
jgi:hypothetical protein